MFLNKDVDGIIEPMNAIKMQSDYSIVRPALKTGDIALFSGKGPISQAIKKGSRSNWSHVAMVVVTKHPRMVLLYQSTTLTKAKDLSSGEPVEGVQINRFSDVVDTYPGEVAIRHLDMDLTPSRVDAFQSLYAEMQGRPYEKSRVELIKAMYDGPMGRNTEDLSSMFCSELVAEVYQRWEILPDNVPSNEYIPKDFSTEESLELLGGATLGDEWVIKA